MVSSRGPKMVQGFIEMSLKERRKYALMYSRTYKRHPISILVKFELVVKTESQDTSGMGTKKLCLREIQCGRSSHKSGVRSPELASL